MGRGHVGQMARHEGPHVSLDDGRSCRVIGGRRAFVSRRHECERDDRDTGGRRELRQPPSPV